MVIQLELGGEMSKDFHYIGFYRPATPEGSRCRQFLVIAQDAGKVKGYCHSAYVRRLDWGTRAPRVGEASILPLFTIL